MPVRGKLYELENCPFSCYIFLMTIEQTVEIPANHRLTIDVPSEVPVGPVILTFTPAANTSEPAAAETGNGCPECAKHRDPVTGELRFNAETIAAFEEGDAMMRDEIPAKRFASFDEMWDDLMKDDPDD